MATNQHGQVGTPPPFDINELNVKSSSKLVERILQILFGYSPFCASSLRCSGSRLLIGPL